MTYKRLASALACGVCIVAIATPASAQTRTYNIPAGSLKSALDAYGRQSGRPIIYKADNIRSARSQGVKGDLTAEAALQAILSGTGFSFRADPSGAIAITSGEARAESAAAESESADIVVTGTNIRGASVTSPIIVISRSDIEAAAQNDLGEVARSIPQNFNGGQNPGVGSGAGLINTNLNSSSQLNLRGLGPDATLTLLNGHRLPYDGAFGGVDLSAIPVAAVERIEIVPDGASAQYGSDAVAGVANVILRKDFTGLTTSARIGGATNGGDFEQGADIVGGASWKSGGFIAAYHFAHNSAITARQRNYTGSLPQDNSLYPEIRQHAVTLSGHQTIADAVEFKIDGIYNNRRSTIIGNNQATNGLSQQRFAPSSENFSVIPEIDVGLGGRWMARASVAYGQDHTRYNTLITPPGTAGTSTSGCYCNTALTTELVADGPLVTLPAGDLRLAVGGGYRSNSMRYSRYTNTTLVGAFDVSRKSHYFFGEAQLPVIGPDQELPFVRTLLFTGAARYEDYPGMASVTTPKLGVLYEPDRNITVKASWGRSFKAPTLYQQYVGYETYLLPARPYGAAPSGSILYTSGGNPSLTPERARSWSATLEVHPVAVRGLRLNASYFNIQYRDRVIEPIAGSIASAFSNPGYASLLSFAPSADLLNGLIAGSLYGLSNFSGAPYAAGNVVALVDNRSRNVAEQQIEGVDFGIAYSRSIAPGQTLGVTGSATYLKSDQILTSLLPTTQLAGTVFNPPHWRARAGAVWDAKRFTLSTFANYIGKLTDARFTPVTSVPSMVTIDLVGRIAVGGSSADRPAFEVTLAINNLFDRRPALIRTSGSSDTPYDSTNFSPIGRFVGLTLSRDW